MWCFLVGSGCGQQIGSRLLKPHEMDGKWEAICVPQDPLRFQQQACLEAGFIPPHCALGGIDLWICLYSFTFKWFAFCSHDLEPPEGPACCPGVCVGEKNPMAMVFFHCLLYRSQQAGHICLGTIFLCFWVSELPIMGLPPLKSVESVALQEPPSLTLKLSPIDSCSQRKNQFSLREPHQIFILYLRELSHPVVDGQN